jgi:hypothetical protein
MASFLDATKGCGAGSFLGDEARSGPAPHFLDRVTAARFRVRFDMVTEAFCKSPAPPTNRLQRTTKAISRAAHIRKVCRHASLRRKEEKTMRNNSGGGKSENNMRDPTVRDHERATGKSGEAIRGEKKAASEPSRMSARKHQSS